MTAPPDPVAALRLAKRLFDEALPHFDWGASALPAEAVCLLNDVPAAVEAALAAVAADDILPEPRPRGPLREADADALRLDIGARAVLVLAIDATPVRTGAFSGTGGGLAFSPEMASALWSGFFRLIAEEAGALIAAEPAALSSANANPEPSP